MDIDGRWVSSIEDLPSHILSTRVDHLPAHVLENLGLRLYNDFTGAAGSWEGVAEELGINTTVELEQIRRRAQMRNVFPGCLLLREWGQGAGSTVFVLLQALRQQRREDCISLVVQACQDVNSMQLLLKIENEAGEHTFLTVSTKRDATLVASLENTLTDLPSYVITGPDRSINWHTQAKHLKGTQLTLKQGQATEESRRSVYGPVSVPQRRGGNSSPSAVSPDAYATQPTRPIEYNIPVMVAPPQSANFQSRTAPKVPDSTVRVPTPVGINDLSGRQQSDNKQSIDSNIHPSKLVERGAQGFDKRALLQKPSCSLDESIRLPSLNPFSQTAPKLSSIGQGGQFSQSFDEDLTALKRSAQERQSRDRRPPKCNNPAPTEYIPITHPVIQFSNTTGTSPSQDVAMRSVSSSPAMARKPPPCVMHDIYVSHDNLPTAGCSPPKPPPKPVRPMPCVLVQRKDGYIEVNTRAGQPTHGMRPSHSVPVLRQQSDSAAVSRTGGPSDSIEKERPKSVPEDFHTAPPPPPPPQCVLSTDSSGYATFAQQTPTSSACVVSRDNSGYASFVSQGSTDMDVDCDNSASSGSAGQLARVPMGTDAHGYLSYSSVSTEESTMDSDTNTSVVNVCVGAPLVIQQSGDGYFGFSETGVNNRPLPCVNSISQFSDYMSMAPSITGANNGSSSSSLRDNNGLTYATFSAEDEEEDADYFDMNKLPRTGQVPNAANMGRNWSDGDIQYLEIMPPLESQYDYIDEGSQASLRSLPAKPLPPVPMKRRRVRPSVPENRTQTGSSGHCDLDTVPGWCPQETEESICSTMKQYQQGDGNFIVWWMTRKTRFVVTVSHLKELRHYAVYERGSGPSVRYFIFHGGYEADNLKALVEHYMREGLKGPDPNLTGNRGKKWQQLAHVKLRKPLKVKYTHTAVRKKTP